jgi:hypothetical protein
MGWTDSRIFTQALLNPIMGRLWTTAAPTLFSSLSADAVNVALFNNTTTPDRDAAVGSTGFNTGVWVTGNEVIDTGGSNWASGGRALASKAFAAGTSIVNFDAADLAGAGNVTIAAAFGAFVYDSTITGGTVAKQGMCFNYFGGSQGVTGGTFTVVWDATGIFKVTL